MALLMQQIGLPFAIGSLSDTAGAHSEGPIFSPNAHFTALTWYQCSKASGFYCERATRSHDQFPIFISQQTSIQSNTQSAGCSLVDYILN